MVTKGDAWVHSLTAQGHGEIFWQDRTVSYFACGGGYMTICSSKCTELSYKRINFTLYKLHLNFKNIFKNDF